MNIESRTRLNRLAQVAVTAVDRLDKRQLILFHRKEEGDLIRPFRLVVQELMNESPLSHILIGGTPRKHTFVASPPRPTSHAFFAISA